MSRRSENSDELRASAAMTRLPTGRRRVYANVAIVAALLFQLLVPLRYYFSGDPFDERFAWRMFSAVRVTRCQAMALERTSHEAAVHPVRLSGGRDRTGTPRYGVIHNAWTTLIRRNRVAVIDAYLEHRCRTAHITEASVVNRCVDLSGQPLPELRWLRRCDDSETSSPRAIDLAAVRGANRPEAP